MTKELKKGEIKLDSELSQHTLFLEIQKNFFKFLNLGTVME